MNSNMFEDLVEKLTPLIKRQDTHLRKSISPAERLAVILRHLATGCWANLFQISYIFFV